MNRFLGPSGFYYGVKPDRTVQKEKLLRQLRQRFPNLSLYPHPAYHQPWLSPKTPPSTYAQVPYFPPGLEFPYVLLKGETAKKARHICHPLGVFHLRPWRFDAPLFNLRMTRRMRQGRFHNVFHQKHGHDRDGKSDVGSLGRHHSSTQLVNALDRRGTISAKLQAHLWSDTSSGPNGQDRLIPRSEHKRFELDNKTAKAARSAGEEHAESDEKEGKKGARRAKSSPSTRSGARAKSKYTKSETEKSKSGKPTPALKGLLKHPNSNAGNEEKSNMFQADSGWKSLPHASDHDTVGGSANYRTEREALETIARRRKRERQLEKEGERRALQQRRAEQEYLKSLLVKSLKKERHCAGPQLKRTRSQKRRALYRRYLEKEKLAPEEEVEHSRRKERLYHRAPNKQKQKSARHPKRFPYGNMPPRFQITPAATDRFFWSEDGPEMRHKQNCDKLNVFHRHSEEILRGVQDDEAVRKTPAHSSSLKPTVGKEGHSTASKKTLPGKVNGIASRILNAVPADHGSRLTAASRAAAVESRSSSASDLVNKVSVQIADRRHVKPDVKSAVPSVVSSTSELLPLHRNNAQQERRRHRHKDPKQKIECQHLEAPDVIQQEIEERAPPIQHPETFLEAREELMSLREHAWRMSIRRRARHQERRQAQINGDTAEREAEIQKIIHPVIEKPDRKTGLTSHLSFGHPPGGAASTFSKQSRRSLLAEVEGAAPATALRENKIFPHAKNRREAFRAYVAKHLLRLKAGLVFKHHLGHVNRDSLLDRWGRPIKTESPLFDNKNPYLVKVIRNLMRTKTGFRFQYETRAEEFLTNFPFVEYQTYRKFPSGCMSVHDRMKHFVRIKKMYRGQRLFKMMTPLRWYNSIKKNSLEAPFDFQLCSDAVANFDRLSKNTNQHDKNEENPGESYHQFGLYEAVCDHLKIPPFKPFQDQLANVIAGKSKSIQLPNQSLTDMQIRPIAMCIMLSELVDHLDVSGNLLGSPGGQYIAGICGHTRQLNELNASNQQFDSVAAQSFFRCLRRPYCKVKKLRLSNCGFGPECAQFLAGIIMENRSLVVLDLSKNRLANVGNNDMFGLALVENNVIEELNLSHNGFGENASSLIFTGATANTSLEIINFAYNHVGDEGCKALAKMLEASDHIRSLNLEHCFLTDVGLKKLGSGIEKNVGTLESLILRDNPITGVGANFILKAVATKEKLRHVDISLCPVSTAFVTGANKAVTEKAEMYLDHTGDKPSQPLLPKYQIDLETIELKKAKADAAMKAKKNK